MHINILQDEKIWNSRHNDFSEKDVTILWSEHGAQLCNWPEPSHERWETSAESSLEMDTLELVCQVIKVLGGCPRVSDKKTDMPEVHDSSKSESDSKMDTDLHKLYIMKQRSSQLRHVPDTGCPSCDFTAVRGIDLYHHIKDLHPQMHEYQCWDCDKQFNTDHDQLNHMNSVHCESVYQYTVCLFSALVESQIQLHILTHSARKYPCQVCDEKLSSKTTLQRHALLHAATGEHKCEHSYTSKLALSVHVKGVHGLGYKCPHCDKVFDILIKKACYLHKCNAAVAGSNSLESPTPDKVTGD